MDCGTVGKLREQLAKLPAEATLIVALETDDRVELFGVDDVSMRRGTPSRDNRGSAAFTFDGTGPTNWAFINISPE
jgi:hypothetical protein